MKYRWSLVTLVAGLSFLTGGWLVRPEPANTDNVYQQARLFEDVLTAIRAHYVDSISETDLYFRATRGIVDYLSDPYSVLLVDDKYRRFNEQISGTEEGLGLQLDVRAGKVTVISVTPGSAADHHGLAAGDQITAIDGVSTKGWNGEQAITVLRGDPGTQVTLLVSRPGMPAPVTHAITRTAVHRSAASPGRLLEDGVGIVTLSSISAESSTELQEQIQGLVDSGMTRLVLDLRYNPGGLVNEGLRIADLFLDPGQTLGTMRGRTAQQTTEYVAQGRQPWPDLPVVVLVNGGTASSAEIVTAALQDHDRAIVVGTPSFGKGAVQSTVPLGRDIAIKLTTARWYTPSGRSIQRPIQLAKPDDVGRVVPADTAVAAPRIFRSDSGRPLPEASGIVPDLVVAPPAQTGAERAFARALGGDLSGYRNVVAAYARELHEEEAVESEDFAVTPAMRAELRKRLEDEGIHVAERVYAAAADFIDRELGNELVLEVFGDAALERRQRRADLQLQAAIDLLRLAETREDLFAAVPPADR